MDFYYRASPSDPKESTKQAFARLTSSWAIARGDLTAQPRSVSALASLLGQSGSARAFFLDHPLAESASERLTSLQTIARERSTEGLKNLLVMFGVRRTGLEPWKALGLSLRVPVDEMVRAGIDLVSMRVAFEAQHDYSRASARPAFRKNAAAAREYFNAKKTELLARAPVEKGPHDGLGPVWGDARKTKDAFAFLARWLREHPEYDRLTVHARGTPAGLLAWSDLFPEGTDHHVRMTIAGVAVADVLPAFDAATYEGLLTLRAEVPERADPDVRDLSLQLSDKGPSLELRSLGELGPTVGKRLGVALRATDID